MFTMPRRVLSLCAVSVGCLFFRGLGAGSGAARAMQTAAASGSLTGTITNAAHKPVNNAHALIASGVVITAEPQATSGVRNPDAFGQGVFGTGESPGRRAASNAGAGGLYTLDKLQPGVYNLMVEAGEINPTSYRPQRVMGVVVRPGQETTLDITLHEGQTLEEVGEPTISASGMRQRGWLEGTIVTPDGRPVHSARSLLATGVIITVSNAGGKLGGFKTDHMAGGFFSLENMVPGTYSLLIEAGSSRARSTARSRSRTSWSSPDSAALLTIVMSEGDGLERVDAPAIKMQPLKIAAQ